MLDVRGCQPPSYSVQCMSAGMLACVHCGAKLCVDGTCIDHRGIVDRGHLQACCGAAAQHARSKDCTMQTARESLRAGQVVMYEPGNMENGCFSSSS